RGAVDVPERPDLHPATRWQGAVLDRLRYPAGEVRVGFEARPFLDPVAVEIGDVGPEPGADLEHPAADEGPDHLGKIRFPIGRGREQLEFAADILLCHALARAGAASVRIVSGP